MDIANLRYFLVAADHLHFGQAADALGIAQPALSQRIKALETRLRVRLFERSTRTVRLTEAGRVFVTEAQRLVNEMDRAVRITRAAENGTAGELRIGYGGSVIFEPKVCALLRAFRDTYPEASVLMHECTVKEQLEGLGAGRLDVALLWGPLGVSYPGIRGSVFCRASMSVVLRQDHRLADKDRIGLKDMQSEAFISLMDPPGMGIGHIVDQLFNAASLSPNVVLRVSSLMSVFGLAGAGLGLGIVPDIPVGINSPTFVQRPLKGVGACNEILIATSKTMTSTLARHFLEAAETLAQR